MDDAQAASLNAGPRPRQTGLARPSLAGRPAGPRGARTQRQKNSLDLTSPSRSSNSSINGGDSPLQSTVASPVQAVFPSHVQQQQQQQQQQSPLQQASRPPPVSVLHPQPEMNTSMNVGPNGMLSVNGYGSASHAQDDSAYSAPPTAVPFPPPTAVPSIVTPAPPYTIHAIPPLNINGIHGTPLSSTSSFHRRQSLSPTTADAAVPPSPAPAPTPPPPSPSRGSSGVKHIPKPPSLVPPPPLSFGSQAQSVLSGPFKALPYEVAQWSFSSAELQEIVRRAIQLSARESFVRLLPLAALDGALDGELARIQGAQRETQAKIRFGVQRRTNVLHAANSAAASAAAATAGAGASDRDSLHSNSNAGGLLSAPAGGAAAGLSPLGDLLVQLSDAAASCDTHMLALYALADEHTQLERAQYRHWASALAIALRKLNARYEKQAGELRAAREKVCNLEQELEEAWKHAETFAKEADEAGEVMVSGSESGSEVDGDEEREEEGQEGEGGIKGGLEVSVGGLMVPGHDRTPGSDSERLSMFDDTATVEVIGVTATAVASKAHFFASPPSSAKHPPSSFSPPPNSPPPALPNSAESTSATFSGDAKSVRSLRSRRSTRSVRSRNNFNNSNTNPVPATERFAAARTRSRAASSASLRFPKPLRNLSISGMDGVASPGPAPPPVPAIPTSAGSHSHSRAHSHSQLHAHSRSQSKTQQQVIIQQDDSFLEMDNFLDLDASEEPMSAISASPGPSPLDQTPPPPPQTEGTTRRAPPSRPVPAPPNQDSTPAPAPTPDHTEDPDPDAPPASSAVPPSAPAPGTHLTIPIPIPTSAFPSPASSRPSPSASALGLGGGIPAMWLAPDKPSAASASASMLGARRPGLARAHSMRGLASACAVLGGGRQRRKSFQGPVARFSTNVPPPPSPRPVGAEDGFEDEVGVDIDGDGDGGTAEAMYSEVAVEEGPTVIDAAQDVTDADASVAEEPANVGDEDGEVPASASVVDGAADAPVHSDAEADAVGEPATPDADVEANADASPPAEAEVETDGVVPPVPPAAASASNGVDAHHDTDFADAESSEATPKAHAEEIKQEETDIHPAAEPSDANTHEDAEGPSSAPTPVDDSAPSPESSSVPAPPAATSSAPAEHKHQDEEAKIPALQIEDALGHSKEYSGDSPMPSASTGASVRLPW